MSANSRGRGKGLNLKAREPITVSPLLLLSLLCGAWLVATKVLGGLVWEMTSEWVYLWFIILALPFFAVVFVWSVMHLARGWTDGKLRAALPVVVNIVALVMVVGPLAPILDRVDFYAHYTARAEVVRRLEAGELWNGSPSHSSVSLPSEYSVSVSNGAGQRGIAVYRDEGVLHAVFYPVGGLFGHSSAFLYRSDGEAPSLPNRVLPTAISSEPLGERWHRVVFKGF